MKPEYYIFALRGWSTLAGGSLLILIPLFMSPIEQGYYYTFSSLVGMQVLFDLGFGSVIVQFVAHEFAHLHIDNKLKLSGPDHIISRLYQLKNILDKWYKFVSSIFFLIAGLVGVIFFRYNAPDHLELWFPPWIILVFFSSLNLYFNSKIAIFEGLGQLYRVTRVKLILSVISYTALWLILILGGGIWISVVIPFFSSVGMMLWISRNEMLKGRDFVLQSNESINWQKDVLPLQWKMALSSACGYLIFSLFTPIIFSNQGPAEAGKIGVTLTIFTTLHLLGSSWISAKVPVLPTLIARNDFISLNKIFKKAHLESLIFTALLCLIAIVVIYLIGIYEIFPSNRLASIDVAILLAIVAICNTTIYSLAVYMRAFKKEPMLLNSIMKYLSLKKPRASSYRIYLLDYLLSARALLETAFLVKYY
ncbi:hypothetical protein EBS02_10515 [bacterium]|nr:hypothetical protein [bacterium]